MRLAVLAHPGNPVAQPFAGGLESHTWHLCRELTAMGVHTTLFAPEGSDPAVATELRPYRAMTLSATAAADATRPSPFDLFQHHALAQAIAAITSEARVDVVHNQTLHYLPIITAGLLPPMVTTLHTPPFSWLESAIRSGGQGSSYVAVSRFVAHEFAGSTQSMAQVIPNGVDTSAFAPGPGGHGLVWTGRIVPEKAPHLAIAAAAAAGRPLRLMGPIGDADYFEHRVRGLLGPRAEYLGHLDRDSVARELQTAGGCLVSSVWPEPFGLAAAESLVCGTPVVGFHVGGLAELIADPAWGRSVPAGDVTAMAAAVDEVITLDRHHISTLARRRLSLTTMASRYHELFEQAMSEERIDRAG